MAAMEMATGAAPAAAMATASPGAPAAGTAVPVRATATAIMDRARELVPVATTAIRRRRPIPAGPTAPGSAALRAATAIASARARPFARIGPAPEGAVSADGKVTGSYLHGMFAEDDFRRAFLAGFGVQAGPQSYAQGVDDTLDRLAAHLAAHIDVEGLLNL